jgi:hypothetical protein
MPKKFELGASGKANLHQSTPNGASIFAYLQNHCPIAGE